MDTKLKQSDADLTLNLYKDANTGAGFILREDGSGYIMIALQNENDAQVGLFSFTPCDTGKELYNKTLEEINKYNKNCSTITLRKWGRGGCALRGDSRVGAGLRSI